MTYEVLVAVLAFRHDAEQGVGSVNILTRARGSDLGPPLLPFVLVVRG